MKTNKEALIAEILAEKSANEKSANVSGTHCCGGVHCCATL